MPETLPIKETKAHCNICGGDRQHNILFFDKSAWQDDESGICGGTDYHMIKCCGCQSIKLRLTEWCSEDPIDKKGNIIPAIKYYPAAIFRAKPRWLNDLLLEVFLDDGNIHTLLNEIYVALQNNQRLLAAMGIRALLEKIMIEKSGDHGSFTKNLSKFESQGYVSRLQRERLETIFEAGHAVIHRLYMPSESDLVTLVDIAESIVESIYIHGSKIEELKKRIPSRTSK